MIVLLPVLAGIVIILNIIIIFIMLKEPKKSNAGRPKGAKNKIKDEKIKNKDAGAYLPSEDIKRVGKNWFSS